MLTASDSLPLQIEGTNKRKRMPISAYFKGKGKEVMGSMEQSYKDPKKAKKVFYATANKNKQTPDDNPKPKRKPLGQALRERLT